jgi:hypothetical protein
VGKPERKRPLGRPRHRWVDNTHEAEWTPFQNHYFSENVVAPEIELGISESVARNSDHQTTEGAILNKSGDRKAARAHKGFRDIKKSGG